MRCFRNILFFAMAVFYVAVSAGLSLYVSHCSCTGKESVSLYVQPATCNEEIEGHQCCSESHSCTDCGEVNAEHEYPDCGCGSPQVFYFQLNDQYLEDTVAALAPAVQLLFAQILVAEYFLSSEPSHIFIKPNEEPPPPNTKKTGRFIVNFNSQRKIAHLA